jgi:hypothetical protein
VRQQRKATIVWIMLAAGMACTQAKQKQAQQKVTPYTVQNDALGESLAKFQKNQTCTPRPGYNGVEGEQTCTTSNTHYAGMWVLGKTGYFYQGRLFRVAISTSTTECKKAELLSLITKRFGEPKLTESVDGKEITPYVVAGGPPMKIWQNGKESILFQESMGPLDACSIMFQLDALNSKVQELTLGHERKKKEAKAKDM